GEELIVDNNAPDAAISIPVSGAKGEAIVLPRPAGSGVEFKITTTEGRTYTAAMSSDLELQAGYIHTFNIRLKSDVEISATIEPWETGPERHYDAVHLVTGLGITEGFETGHELDLFLKEGAAPDFGLLRKYTLDGENKWIPASPAYWENIAGSPAIFRGATVYEDALNNTQMPDILVSKDIEVAPFKGINLELEHVGSKVNIVLQSSDGTYTNADLEGATVVLPGYLNSGAYDPDTGEFIPGTTTGDISPEEGVAIFPPQTINNGNNLLVVTIDGREYPVKVEDAAGFEYEKGHEYTLVVDARKANVELSAVVTPWIQETREFNEIRVGPANLDNNGGDLVDGDELYLFAGDNTDRSTLPGKFVYNDATDEWTYEGPSAPLYWGDITDEGNLYASITRPAMDATAGNNQSRDYITATPIANNGGTDNTALNFKMEHKVARVNVMLRSGTHSEANLLNATVTLPGYAIGDGLDKGVYVPGTSTGDIRLAKPAKTGTAPNLIYSTSSYLQPQTVALGDELVVVEINGDTYTVMPDDLVGGGATPVEYQAGKVTNLVITIEKSGVALSVEVTPWTDLAPMEFGVIHLVTGLGVTDGFIAGHELDLFLKGASDSDFASYETFEYQGSNVWTPASPVYWEDLKDLPVTFRGATIYETALNSTQMADILISKDVTVAPFTGVNLEMEHAGAKVNVLLQSSDGTYTAADLNNATIILPDYLNSGSYNNKGEFVPATSRDDISPEDGVAIFPPQTIANGKNLIEVTLDGRLYEVKVEQAAGFEYKKGHEYTLVVDAVKAKVELSTVVTPWVEETFEYSEVRVGPTMLDDNEGDLVDEDELYLFAGNNTNRSTLPGKFVYDETTNTWSYEGTSAPLYWEDITDEGNLYASITRPAMDATAGNNQSADYITATPIANNGGTNNTALNFKMEHKVARVNVMLRSNTYEEAKLLNANVTLPGYAIGGGLDKGIYVPGTGIGPIKLDKPVKTSTAPDPDTYTTSSYLQPQTIALGQALVTVEIEGRIYTVKPEELIGTAAPVEYEAG
ncbi:MAG: fimbrillin family protein, partial [Proteiniphilum sp.]